MKRVKFGIAIVFLAVIVYCIVSFTIFFDKKESIDTQLLLSEQSVDQSMIASNQAVIIQNVGSVTCQECHNPMQGNDEKSDFIVTDDADEQQLPIVVAEPQEEFFVSIDRSKKLKKVNSYSFMTMPLTDDYSMDQETHDALDVLIGNDVEGFVRLVLQSNNNIVSKEACRSCGMYAFFNGIKNHKNLTVEDIVLLQKLLVNFYRFVEKMQKLSHEALLLPEQYEALQDLHRSQDIKNDIKLKKRFAVTSAALKKLQNIKYNN